MAATPGIEWSTLRKISLRNVQEWSVLFWINTGSSAHKTTVIRLLTTHFINHLLEKQGRSHSRPSPVEYHIWWRQCWLASRNFDSKDLCGHGMSSRELAKDCSSFWNPYWLPSLLIPPPKVKKQIKRKMTALSVVINDCLIHYGQRKTI